MTGCRGVAVAQMVRASGCGPEGRGFKLRQSLPWASQPIKNPVNAGFILFREVGALLWHCLFDYSIE